MSNKYTCVAYKIHKVACVYLFRFQHTQKVLYENGEVAMQNKTLVITRTHREYIDWLAFQKAYNIQNTIPVSRINQLRGIARGLNAVIIGFPEENGFRDVFQSRQLNILEPSGGHAGRKTVEVNCS